MSTANARDAEVLIVGQGLAGSVLAWQFERRGVSITVVDRGGVDQSGRPCASQLAAGLVTPITGKRLTLDPRWRDLRDTAAELYRYAEEQLGAAFFHEKPSLRLLDSAAEQQQLARRLKSAAYARQAVRADPAQLPATLCAEWGGFWMPDAARLDVPRFVQLTRDWLAATGRLRTATITLDELDADEGGVTLSALGLRARLVVFCQGAVPPEQLPRDCPQVIADKGELLSVECPDLAIDFVAHRGVWLAPQQAVGVSTYLVGSTYAWGQLDSEPTPEARESILTNLSRLTTAEVTVLEQSAAPRPSAENRVPLAGFSPSQPRIGWFNGLGAKGVLWAPWHAGRLADACAVKGS